MTEQHLILGTSSPTVPSSYYRPPSKPAGATPHLLAAILVFSTLAPTVDAKSKFVDTAATSIAAAAPAAVRQKEEPSIATLFTEIASSIPKEEWEAMPSDLSSRFRHYSYTNS